MNAPARFSCVLFVTIIVGFLGAKESLAALLHNSQNRYVKSEVFVAPPESGIFEENQEIVSFDFDPFTPVAAVTMTNLGGSASAASDQSSNLGNDSIDAVGSTEASMFAQAFVDDEYGFGETHFEVNFEVLVAGDYLFDAFALSAGDNFFSTESYVQLFDLNGPFNISVFANDPAVSLPISLPAGEYSIIAHSRVDITSNFNPELQNSNASASFGVTLQSVPEPGTLALLTIGFFAMAARRRSR